MAIIVTALTLFAAEENLPGKACRSGGLVDALKAARFEESPVQSGCATSWRWHEVNRTGAGADRAGIGAHSLGTCSSRKHCGHSRKNSLSHVILHSLSRCRPNLSRAAHGSPAVGVAATPAVDCRAATGNVAANRMARVGGDRSRGRQ